MRRKFPIVAALSLATFAGYSSGLALQLVPKPQSALYGVTTTQMAYQNSCATGGMAIGGFIFFPLSHKFGRSSAVFWSLFGLMIAQIWGACMTRPDDYAHYLGSRFLAGFFGSVTGILGPRILIDLFFLHQRGRAFTAFHFFFDFGTVCGPTLGAFVAAGRSWTAAVWYEFALVTFALILCFFFLHETAWDREPGASHDSSPSGFITNRFATFFPGTKVAPPTSWLQFASILEFLLGLLLFHIPVLFHSSVVQIC